MKRAVGSVRPNGDSFTSGDCYARTGSGRVADDCRVVDGGRVTAGVVNGVLL